MKRFFLVLVLCVLLLAPFVAFAQERDPGCKTDVTKTGEPVICLAVPFGTVVKVSGISQYIQQFYNFFIGAVLSLAIFMIVIGGVQWVFALGNPGKIGSAKKTITNAFLGVLLAFISVGMLRIINPDLITLKLPEIRSVEQNQFTGGQACHLLPTGKTVISNGVEITIDGNPDTRWAFECGQTYKVVGGSPSQCYGASCYNPDSNTEGVCINGGCVWGNSMLAGSINWDGNYYVDYMWLLAVCPDNVLVKVVGNDPPQADIKEFARSYTYPIDSRQLLGRDRGLNIKTGQSLGIEYYCGSGVPLGYLLQVEVNDASSLWPTKDDKIVLGKDCTTPLRNANDPKDMVGEGEPIAAGTPLFSAEELKGAVQCDIQIAVNAQPGSNGGGNPVPGVAFQAGIQAHWPHATAAVQNAINKIAAKKSLVVKSISDNDLFTGKCEPWKPEFIGTDHTNQSQEAAEYLNASVAIRTQYEDFQNDAECVHKKGSAHYGGTVPKGVEVKNFSGTVLGKGRAPATSADVSAGGFSCAADLGPALPETAAAWAELLSAIQAVNTENAGALMEIRVVDEVASANHYHIGVSFPGEICYANDTGQAAY